MQLPGQPLKRATVQRNLRSLGAQSACPEWWTPLYQSAFNGAAFLSQDWIETWLETYGIDFEGSWVWWTSDEKVVGGCLLLTRRISIAGMEFQSLFLNAAGFTSARSPVAECNDVLCVEGFDEAVADDMIALLAEMEWDRFVLVACLTDGVIKRVVTGTPSIKTEFENKPAPYIKLLELPDGPFTTHLTGNTRSQVQRCRRIYESTDGPVTVSPAPDLETAMEYFEEMARMHNDRWTSKGMAGSFSNQLAAGFHRKLIRRLWSSGAVDLVCVKAGAVTIGVLYNFIGHDKVYFFQSGFAYQKNNKLKPGLLTHCMAIENYRLQGMREYDFLAGESRYKRSLETHERALFWATIYRDNRSVRLLMLAKKLKGLLEKYKSKLKRIVPAFLGTHTYWDVVECALRGPYAC
ncbi:hypothetical protein BH11PSE11_BH11PSE11_28940 [soil metagenome]